MRKQYLAQSFVLFIGIFIIFPNLAFSAENEPLILPKYFMKMKNEMKKSDRIEKKIGGLLQLQIQLRNSYTEQPTPERLNAMRSMGMKTVEEEIDMQFVYIHTKRKLSTFRIASFKKIGVIVYEDSWIPPLENHPTGFVIARMPVDRLYDLARKPFVIRLETAEQMLLPKNDKAAKSIYANNVWEDYGYDGTDVRIAVLDSGLDITHKDIPTPVASKDYSEYPDLDDTIENLVIGHGTHVTGSAVGRGTQSSGKYKGMAYGADLIFLKIGDDSTGGASCKAISEAIRASVDTYDANIITMSYGSFYFDTYKDGSDEKCQAVNYAFDKGALVFIAAGNEAEDKMHYSGTVTANSTTDYIKITMDANTSMPILYLNWFDGKGISNNLDLSIYNAKKRALSSPDVSWEEENESPRGTEAELVTLNFSVSKLKKKYFLKVKNNSNSDQFFHIYSSTGSVTFRNRDADPNYTIGSPAIADNAIAVGSYVTRPSWTNYKGKSSYYQNDLTVGNISTFSSRGPRIDGIKKPDISAPGQGVISARDKIITWPGSEDVYVIDNDGINDGNGPADYLLKQGTSMACPIAAGAAALLMQSNSSLKENPDTIRNALFQTASNNGDQTNTDGYGKINVLSALDFILTCTTTVSSDRWKGEYYNNKDLSGSPTMVRDDGDGNLNFDWESDSPSSSCEIGADNFSVRWTRTVSFDANDYRFTMTSDDGFRLYIDDELKLNKWIDQGATTYTVDVSLSAGNHTIKMEYYENGGNAVARLSWKEAPTDDNPPSVSITSPVDGATVSSTVTVSADATDDNGINKVEFYLDDVLKSTDTSSPYSWSWDTTQSTNDSHTLKAIAYDTSNQTATSQISVTVNNTTTSIAVTSFKINNDAASTTSRNVTLNNTAIGSPTQYIASESSSFNSTNWQTYSTNPSFTLSSGNGTKTVYFKVRNSAGTESAVVSDSITLSVSCTYSINPTAQSFGSSGGSGSVSVTTQSGCNWTAVSNNTSWITITSGSSGSGNGTVYYSVAANSSASSLTGTMTIAGNTFTVTQSGTSCTYSISPTSKSFDSSGGSGSVTVTTQSGCSWTATSNASWITITSGSSGTGSGTVNYSVTANTSTRTGTITITGGNTFTITQSGTGGELPDLTSSATVASSLFYTSGQTGVQIPVTVYRSGGNLTSGTYVHAKLYWSTDSTWDTGDSIKWSSNDSTPDFPNSVLNSNGTKTVTATVDIPSVSSGIYYIISYADAPTSSYPSGYYSESNEDNNTSPHKVSISDNPPPTAGFTMSAQEKTAYENETLNLTVASGQTVSVSFSASRSSDSDGSIASYKWSINGTEVSTSRDFSYSLGEGTHQIYLEVLDNQGASDAVGASIIITSNPPPTAAFTMTAQGKTAYENETLNLAVASGQTVSVSFSASRSSDSDGSIASYKWSINGTEVSTSRDFSYSLGEGTHQIYLEVLDNQGASDAVGASIIITSNPPPTAAFTMIAQGKTAYENETLNLTVASGQTVSVSFSAARSSDSDGSIASYKWSINGTTVSTSRDFSYNLGSGTHQIYLEVWDNLDSKSAVGATISITSVSVSYQGHFANTDWGSWVSNGTTCGTPGGNQMEAIKITTSSYGIQYRAHVADYGWLSWVSDGGMAGTTGQSKSLQAIEIKLTSAPSNLHVSYRVYVHGQGWQSWVSDGSTAGTTGQGLAIEAIEIKLENW